MAVGEAELGQSRRVGVRVPCHAAAQIEIHHGPITADQSVASALPNVVDGRCSGRLALIERGFDIGLRSILDRLHAVSHLEALGEVVVDRADLDEIVLHRRREEVDVLVYVPALFGGRQVDCQPRAFLKWLGPGEGSCHAAFYLEQRHTVLDRAS